MRFSELSDEEEEILDILQEECAEVIQAIAKIKRHGYVSEHPGKSRHSDSNNLNDLVRELGDLDCIRDIWSRSMGSSNHNINKARSAAAALEKLDRLKKYTHHIDWSKYL